MSLIPVATTIILLHTASSAEVEVNPALITHMFAPDPGHPHFTKLVHCLIYMAGGKFVTVVETCETVRKAIEERATPPRTR